MKTTESTTDKLLASARKATEGIKKSSEKLDASGDGWRLIPTFTKYELKGKIVRNAKTKRPMSPKKANGKYQLIADDGRNLDRSIDDLNALVPSKPETRKKAAPAAVKAKKTATATGGKSKKETILDLHKQGLTNNEIVKQTGFGYTTVYGAVNDYTIDKLWSNGKTAEEIATKLGRDKVFITAWLKRYNYIK